MDLASTLAQLESAGTAQNRKLYARHGCQEPMFGVSFAALKALKQAIKRDHDLSLALWESGNHDARVLATMVAVPSSMRTADLDAWGKDANSAILADYVASVVVDTPFAASRAEKWKDAKSEWLGRAGWTVIARLSHDASIPDSFFVPLLAQIEDEIHHRKNRVREGMYSALIAIGARGGELTDAALAAAKRIGTVDIDHGETGCKTPDAVEYITRTLAHRGRKTSS